MFRVDWIEKNENAYLRPSESELVGFAKTHLPDGQHLAAGRITYPPACDFQ
ncbi:hypothetical protein [Neisseria sp. 74A18]|uniref:hypothetical protein n=1 Tax=Neisseria sp. 74A18 TaxID=1696094 RepID=UPI000A7908C5|nr:hypothetical protein [Neisseria sp. 74A18]